MRKYAMEIAQFAGKRSRECYDVLACAVEVARSHMPRESQMNEICQEAGRLCEKEEKAVYQAISRAVKDIWEYGNIPNLEKVICYSLCVKPSPKELVTSLAQAFWNREMESGSALRFQVLEAGLPPQYGIWGTTISGDDGCVVVAPFTSNREKAEEIVSSLNQSHMTAVVFRDQLINGHLLDKFEK